MQLEEMLKQADEILFQQTGERLDDLQSAILESALQGKKYTEVASEHYLTEGHIRDVAYKLWNALSISLGEEVNKSNLKSAMERSYVFNIKNSGNSINSGKIDNIGLPFKYANSGRLANQNRDSIDKTTMLTFIHLKGWQFLFCTEESDEPIHIYVQRGESECKYWLDIDLYEIREDYIHEMSSQDIREVKKIILQNFAEIIDEYQRLKGQ